VYRFLIALVLVRLLAQSTWIDAAVHDCSDTPCDSDCGNCPPDCDDCACCPHQRPLMFTVAAAAPLLDIGAVEFVAPSDPVEDPRALEILHIPKAARFV
jgi:hypothetical protein